jgi:hypothetical protein
MTSIGLEDSKHLGKRQPDVQPPPFAGVPHPVDVEAIRPLSKSKKPAPYWAKRKPSRLSRDQARTASSCTFSRALG